MTVENYDLAVMVLEIKKMFLGFSFANIVKFFSIKYFCSHSHRHGIIPLAFLKLASHQIFGPKTLFLNIKIKVK